MSYKIAADNCGSNSVVSVGDIVYEFSEAININTVISDNDYIGVSNNVKQESYYVSTSGKKLEIVE